LLIAKGAEGPEDVGLIVVDRKRREILAGLIRHPVEAHAERSRDREALIQIWTPLVACRGADRRLSFADGLAKGRLAETPQFHELVELLGESHGSITASDGGTFHTNSANL